jgi:hypothetical protein
MTCWDIEGVESTFIPLGTGRCLPNNKALYCERTRSVKSCARVEGLAAPLSQVLVLGALATSAHYVDQTLPFVCPFQ